MAFKLGMPSLDLSGLKNNREYKDWYGYSQKLENAINLLREKNDSLENSINTFIVREKKTEEMLSKLKT